MCQTCGGKNKAREAVIAAAAAAEKGLPEPMPASMVSDAPSLQYKIENLTITNYGTINIFPQTVNQSAPVTQPLPKPSKNEPVIKADGIAKPEGVFSTSRTAWCGFSHNLPVTLASVTMSHKYDDRSESKTWKNVAPNTKTSTSDLFSANYETGIGTKLDYWTLSIEFSDGTTFYNKWKECMLESSDDHNNGGALWFTLDKNTFNISLRSGGCSDTLTYSNGPFNAFAFISVRNDFPVAAQVTITHKSDENGAVKTSPWPDSLNAGQTSVPWPVYFATGVGSPWDYWNATVLLDVDAPANAPKLAQSHMQNAKKDKECYLASSDVGRSSTFVVNPTAFKLNMPVSSGCSDDWTTPAGYNTVSFVYIQNKFSQDICSVVLKHQYSDDTTYEYDYGVIPQGQTSTECQMMEYFTGATHPGYDYWDVSVFLADGTWYNNNKTGKRCYMETSDAKALTFDVSDSNFGINLPSGGCSDGMSNKGKFDILHGADPNRPYNKNCYLASHNAMATWAEGYPVANQSVSISTQLAMGATTLLVDVWDRDGDIYLLHNWANAPFSRERTLAEGLAVIKAFMNRFPEAVVTIVLEDKLDAASRPLLKQRFQESGLYDMQYKPSNPSTWDTLADMAKKNQRVVIFTDDSITTDFLYQWSYMDENVYGNDSLNPSTWLNKRGESDEYGTHALSALNHFPTIQAGQGTFNWDLLNTTNSQSSLQAHIDGLLKCIPAGPNFVQVDFINYGWCIGAVNYSNQKFGGATHPQPVMLAENRFAILEAAPPSTTTAERAHSHSDHGEEKPRPVTQEIPKPESIVPRTATPAIAVNA